MAMLPPREMPKTNEDSAWDIKVVTAYHVREISYYT